MGGKKYTLIGDIKWRLKVIKFEFTNGGKFLFFEHLIGCSFFLVEFSFVCGFTSYF